MTHTKFFNEISKCDAATAGGKGASLGEMIQAGISVPPGFVIVAGTFNQFLAHADIQVDIENILKKADHAKMHTVEEASEQIHAIIENADVEKSIENAILKSFDALGAKYVAVRSSATAEDGATDAWAGQLNTYLNTTREDVMTNVKKCWASLFSPRAIFYRFEKGLRNDDISVAVVIQEMIQSEVSGVAFSVHPVTEDHNQIIIEAGLGLGEAVVSGEITPDSYVITKDTPKLIDTNIVVQKKQLVCVKGKNVWQVLEEPTGSSQKLNDDQIFELSRIIMTIENHYGFPCDIEWAYADKKLYITQSRPITTLQSIEIVPERESEFFSQKITSVIDAQMMGRLRDESWFKIVRRENSPLWESLIRVGGTRQNKGWDFMNPMTDFFALNYDTYASVEAYEILKSLFKKKCEEDVYYLRTFFEHLERNCDALLRFATEVGSVDFTSCSNDNLHEYISSYITQSLQILSYLWMPLAPEDWIVAEITTRLSKKIDPLSEYDELQQALRVLIAPIELTDIQQKENELIRLAHEMEGQGMNMSDTSVQKALQKIHRAYAWIPDSALKFEYEAFTATCEQFESLRRDGTKPLNVDSLTKEKEQLQARLSLSKETIALCDAAAQLSHWRLLRTEQIVQATYLLHGLFLEIEARIDEENITNLYFWEITDALVSKHVVEGKIQKRTDGFGLLITSDVIYAVGVTEAKKLKNTIDQEVASSGNEIMGQTAQKGFVVGKVVVALTLVDAKRLKEGDILVTSMTTPNYVPYMKIAGAIVTDEGGISCHAAIVSREMKKPCIIGTKIATQVLRDGDLLEVDATNGIVTILKKANE